MINQRTLIKIIIIVITIATAFIATPLQLQKFNKINKNIIVLEEKISKIQKENSTKPETLAEAEKIKQEIEILKAKVISYQDIASLQAYISAQAKESSIEITETSSLMTQFYKQIGKDKYSMIPLSLSLRCKYHNLGKFLSKIEQGEYPLKIKNLVIAAEKTNHIVSLNISALAKE